MPTLHWIGKEKVINHHQDVPYRILEKQYTFANGKEDDSVTSENKIIHGDNLEALKSLLPEYEGKVKCIYIDPPYNTGNEGWVYNDNVNHPKLKKWLGKVVGKESEDLSRHDKWLCMMYPRLKILSKLLCRSGSLWVSIDDNEMPNMRLILDEVFGSSGFVASNVWQKRYSRENRGIIGDVHEYILVYTKSFEEFKESSNRLPLTEKQAKIYKNPNNDKRGRWRTIPMTAQGFRPNQMYDIIGPNGFVHKPPEGRCWSMLEDKFKELEKEGRIYFGKNGDAQPSVVRYLYEVPGVIPWTWWTSEEVGHTDESRKEIRSIFGTQTMFETPKPVRLIDRILRIATNKKSIILDSFAGSGTTAHAVLNLNKSDGGDRKFILIEMEDYANDITAERVKRVIKGYGTDKKVVTGTGGDFSYYELGQPIFLENEYLNEAIDKEKIEEYVWYTETKTPYDPNPESYLLGMKDDTAYYFYYEKDSLTTLDENYLRTLKTKARQYIIYADLCLLDKALMDKYHIVFKKIPRDITRF